MRPRAYACACGWLVAAVLGCGTSATLAPAEVPTLAAADEARVRALAPDLYARALAVRELALDSAEREVAEEHAARARLLFEAAALEADRLELERRHEALLRETGRDEQARVAALEALRVAERDRRLAAIEARGEATAALSARERQLLRARALLGAAHALHAPAEALQTAENALLGAELDGAASAKAVERALAAAERAVEAARALKPAAAAQAAPEVSAGSTRAPTRPASPAPGPDHGPRPAN